jgi:Sugar (and other) transporter
MIVGFIMVFFVQVAGNAMQIFASEVFPTNARASGFGWASGVGRLATAIILPTILWVQNGFGLTTVFVCLAILLFIAAVSVTQLGPEAKQKGLDEVEPPTNKFIEAGNVFWLRFAGVLFVGISFFWWAYFYINVVKDPGSSVACLLYTTEGCAVSVGAAELAGQWAYRPYLMWIGIALILGSFLLNTLQGQATKKTRSAP